MSYFRSFLYAHFSGSINSGNPLQIKSGPGVLRAVCLNTIGASPAQITLSDGIVGASPVTIAMILPAASSTACPNDAIFDLRFNAGLVIQGNGASMDITVMYE